jgi:hypothetical protein
MENLVEVLKIEPYEELAYYLAKEYEETSLAEETAVMHGWDSVITWEPMRMEPPSWRPLPVPL